MATIKGLLEQQKALSEINTILKEVEKINEFLDVPNPTNMFQLSFSVPVSPTVEVPLANEPVKDEIQVKGNKKKETAKESNTKRKARVKTHETYMVPLYCENPKDLYQFIILYKNQKRDHILSLANEFNIELDEVDKAILDKN